MLGAEPGASIRWQCGLCDDAGLISNWENSPFNLRAALSPSLTSLHKIVVSHEVAAALRDLRLLDPDGDPLCLHSMEELIGSLAAEANHEPNRHRRQRLDAAFDALNDAAAERR